MYDIIIIFRIRIFMMAFLKIRKHTRRVIQILKPHII